MSPDPTGRQWVRLLSKLRELAAEYGRMHADRRALHFAAMHSTLLALAMLAELHGASGHGWTTLMAYAPPESDGLHARVSVTIIGGNAARGSR